MKRLNLLLILLILSYKANYGQEWIWSDELECTNDVTPTNIAVDDNNNVYLIGTYESPSLTIQGITVPNSGDKDGYLCKFSSDGILQWLRGFGSVDRDFAVAINIVENSIYIAGDFRNGAIYFTPTDSLENVNNFDAFLAEFDLDGNFIDAIRIFHGSNIQRIKGMIYSSVEDILIIIGQFKDEFTYFDGTSDITVNPRGAAGKDHFVVKSTLSGEIQDTTFFQTTQNGTILKDVNLATNEGYYIAGDVFDLIEFSTPSNTLTGSSATTADAFIVKLNTDLDFQWARKGGGIGYDHANNSISDIYGNVYITGKAEADVVFDSTATLSSAIISGFGAQDLYLAKYNKLGTLQWVKRKGDAGNDDGFGLIQRENLVQFCGNISGQVIFNEDTLQSTGITDMNTGFAIFNTKGDEIGAQGIGGSDEDVGSAITFDINGNTIISGYSISDTLVIGDSSYINVTGTYNGFIGAYYYPMKAVYTTIEHIACNGESSGRLIITPYFGIGPYNYSWSPNVTSSNDSLAYNLSADTYSVTITDSRLITASNTIELTEPTAISILADLTDVSCHPWNGTSNDGTIDLTVSGGTVAGAYDYSWEAISGSGVAASSEDQTTLTKGQYSVIVTDDNLCEAYDTFLIDQPDSITFESSTVTNETIPPGSNGAIDLEVSGGTPGFVFDWDGPSGFDSSDEDISNLSGGNYFVLVTDVNTCEADTTFLVVNDTMLIAYISNKVDVDCKDNSTGSATVAVSGGTGPYDYEWENSIGQSVGGNSPNLIDIPRGTYYVTVTDNFDARTAETSVQIQEPTQELLASITGTNLNCFNDNSGIADLTVSGGTLPYAFQWSNSATTEDLVDVPAANYSVTVTDINDCMVTDEIEITQPSALDINITITQPIFCNGDLTGILTATATGGTGTKFYIWDDPANQTTQTATGLEAGFYNVTATDLNDCAVTDNIQLTEPAILVLSETHQDVSCFGSSDGLINLSVSGGTPQYNYSWSSGQVSQDISDLPGGDYSVTVTDLYNCAEELNDIIILEPGAITLVSTEITDITCYGYDDGSIIITATSPVGGLTYSIDDGDTYLDNEGIFTALPAGNYFIWISDGNDCEQEFSSVDIVQPDQIIVDTNVTHVSGNQLGEIEIIATGGIPPYTYHIYSVNIDSSNSTGIFIDLVPDDYMVHVTDEDICSSDTLVVSIIQTTTGLVIYDAFSPNNDGMNEVWNIGNIDLYPDCIVTIFNTWGNKVFSSNGYSEPWDGTYNNKDLPAGTYYYIIDLGDDSEPLSGPVSIVK